MSEIKPAPAFAPHLAHGRWTVDHAGYIWAPSLKGGHTNPAQVRGWGYLTGGGHGALRLSEGEAIAAQAAWGALIVDAVNDALYPDPEWVAARDRLIECAGKEGHWVERRCGGETDSVLVSKADLRRLLKLEPETPEEPHGE